MSEITLSRLFEELSALRGEVQQLRAQLNVSASQQQDESLRTAHLHVFFDSFEGERKPFLIKMDGILTASLTLSSIRTAILLVLLLDLQDRFENGRGVTDPLDTVIKTHIALSGEEDNTLLRNSIRVALYRFGQFFEKRKEFHGEHYALRFNAKELTLNIADERGRNVAEKIVVEVTSNNPSISAVADEILATSPLQRVRKRKTLFVPEGPEGLDRLLLELYDHPYPVKVTSLYFRPSAQTYPTTLLQRMGFSEANLLRKQVMLAGYKSGRCEFTEVLNHSTIWNMIRQRPEGGFLPYPDNVGEDFVLEHLSYLIYKLETFEAYRLVLTDAQFPFYLGTYEIKSARMPEYFTVFFRRAASEYVHGVSVFVLNDPLVTQAIAQNVIQWVMAHPTTVHDRGEVIRFVKQVREHLKTKGPIKVH